jgi:peptidoglycan/LPS O-acetylase OafA/YrhL
MKLTYRPEIDGLRAIAVGAVILYHAQITILGYQPFKGGFIGVDIFFVISGYLITSIILKELVTTGTFSFKHFYERRVRRILPALLFVMLVSLPFAWMYLLPSSFVDFSKSILYSLGFSSNFYFYYSGQEYGAESGLLKPFLHTWSLSVEEQFYILFPIVLLITFKYFRKYLIHILILGFVISLGLAEWGSRNHPSFNFYVLPTRGWELLAGSILAYFEINNAHRNKNKTLNLILPTIGLLLIGHSILFFNDEMFHPSFYTLSPIIGVCLIIWFSSKNELITKILSTKLFVGIGLISYSLYLWHYPIFSFARIKDNTPSEYDKFEWVVLSIILSLISYFFVERPFRNKKYGFRKIIIIVGFCSSILIILNITNIYFEGFKNKVHPFTYKYDDEHKKFEKNYNYNNFSNKKNIFIVGNSYADDLLNTVYYNSELQREYYFYTAVADDIGKNFQIECVPGFLNKISNNICYKEKFSFFDEQYKKSEFIIFAIRDNEHYLQKHFDETVNLLKKDNKKFIVFLNDLHGSDILDRYIRNELFRKLDRIPSPSVIKNLEEKFYLNSKKFEKKIISSVKKKFNQNNIKFVTRSEIYCKHLEKRCHLIKNENKIYQDYGHLTDNGAKYFSNNIKILIEKLVN